jgi:hypothetical protein
VIGFLLVFFQFLDVFFNAVRGSPSNCNFALHYLVVLFNLLKSAIQLIELFLRFKNSLELFISLFFFSFVLSL